jgi:hypothetical protein
MGWAYGEVNGKAVGHSVPDVCNELGCDEVIDRGLGYACGDMPGSGLGCDGFFCEQHLFHNTVTNDKPRKLCRACFEDLKASFPANDTEFDAYE